MDPVGQNRPIVLPDPGSRPIEFLLRVLDLSKGGVAGASVAATFTPSLLERALAAEGAGPLRFLPLPPPLSRPLLRVLSSPDLSSGAPRINLLVTRHENGLEWIFSGKDLQTTFRSDLLQSRSGAVALQPWTEPSPSTPSPVYSDGTPPLQGSDGWLSGTLSSLSEESVSGDRVFGAGILRGTIGAGGAKGSGPVMAWPAFIPGQTIEFSVRWVSAEEAEGESKALGQGGEGGHCLYPRHSLGGSRRVGTVKERPPHGAIPEGGDACAFCLGPSRILSSPSFGTPGNSRREPSDLSRGGAAAYAARSG